VAAKQGRPVFALSQAHAALRHEEDHRAQAGMFARRPSGNTGSGGSKFLIACTTLESLDVFALLLFSLTSAHVTWASFSSMKEESDCLVEVEDRDSRGVDSEEALDVAEGLASRRLGRLDVMSTFNRF